MPKKHHRPVTLGQVQLRPGSHVIDGAHIQVPAEEGRDWVWYRLPAGIHVIDEVITRVDAGVSPQPDPAEDAEPVPGAGGPTGELGELTPEMREVMKSNSNQLDEILRDPTKQ